MATENVAEKEFISEKNELELIKNADKRPGMCNPFINNIFNHQDLESSSTLKDLLKTLCESPAEYTILVPSSIFLSQNRDQDSGKFYTELCTDLDFILTHIIRINVTKEPRIRSHKEYTTLNNKVVHIENDEIKSLRGFKHPVSVRILKQQFLRGFSNYIPFGVCFHIIHITDCLVGTPKLNSNKESLFNSIHQIQSDIPKDDKIMKPSDSDKHNILHFSLIIENNVSLLEINEKFTTLFNEYSFKCKTIEDLNKTFTAIIKRGSAIFNTLNPSVLTILLRSYTKEELKESVYNYLEMGVYEKLWNRFLKICPNSDDSKMELVYDQLKWLSITEINLPDEIVTDNSMLFKYINKVIKAIEVFKKIVKCKTSFEKCKIIMNTVEILSSDSKIDADNLVALLIFVICLAKVNNLNNHLKYIHQYAYSEHDTEAGILGYALSTLEVAVKYFHDTDKLHSIVSKSLENEVLWRLIGAVSSDYSNKGNKKDDETIFIQIEQLLKPFNKPGYSLPTDNFIRSRTLDGESCLLYALKQNNEELMNVLLQFEYIFTLDDILEDKNIEGSNLLAVALDQEHPSANILAQIILQAKKDEIIEYVNNEDLNKRTVGHFLHSAYSLIPDLGKYIDWTKRDLSGSTPLMVFIRCYDHPKYDELMYFTINTVKEWYVEQKRLFSHRDHLDKRRNTLMHIIRDSKTLEFFLKTFKGLEMNFLNEQNQSAVSLAVRYNRIDNVEILINDKRVCLGVVDSSMFMSALDYVKLERWAEPVNRHIAKILENAFILTEYGEILDIACVRARFEPEYGLCCYFRVINTLGKSDLILVPFSSLVKVFKLMKKENPSIPFDFGDSEFWFPKHLDVSMKGNISSSNKLKINLLINNLNLLIQTLYRNGTLEYTDSFQNYLLVPQEPCKIEVKPVDERKVLKEIYGKRYKHRKLVLLNKDNFRKMILNSNDIHMYRTFLEYTINELQQFGNLFYKFYQKYALADYGAKSLDKLRTDIPWIVKSCLKFRECRLEDSSDIFLDKIRLLYASVNELIKVGNDLNTGKIQKWKKLVSDLRNVRNELDRIAGSRVDGSACPSPSIEPPNTANNQKKNRKVVLAKIFKQIDVLTGDCTDSMVIENFRKDIIRVLFKGKISNNSSPNINASNSFDNDISENNSLTESLEELIDVDDTGIGSWFVEKRRITYVRKLLENFLKYRIELIEVNIELKKLYENFAVFVSKFYQFRIDIHKNAYGEYAKGKIAELKREVQSWELWLREYKSKKL